LIPRAVAVSLAVVAMNKLSRLAGAAALGSLVLSAACSPETGPLDETPDQAGTGGSLAAGTSGVGGSGAGVGGASGGTAGGSAGSAVTGGAGGVGTGGSSGASGGSSGSAGSSGSGGASGAAGSGGAAGSAGGSGGSSGAGTSGSAGSSAGSAGAPVITDRSPEGTCQRWNADRANRDEGTWSGSVDTCTAGDISPDGRANALRLFNLYRWLADLPEVTTTPERDQMAQECALMQEANWREEGLSHSPPESWLCYTELGAEGASTSNISGGPGVSSVDAYLVDGGNETTFGHRRIILSNWLGPIGLGSTGDGGASCMQNIGGDGDAGKEWLAWPPPGAFPIQAYAPGRGQSYSDTGWSIQSEDMDLGNATVTVTSGGTELAVDVSNLTGNYGSTEGIRIVPNGWEPEAGQTYAVAVAGVTPPIAYEIQMVDCAQ